MVILIIIINNNNNNTNNNNTSAPFKPNPIFNPKEDHVKQAPYLIKFTSLQDRCWWAKKQVK